MEPLIREAAAGDAGEVGRVGHAAWVAGLAPLLPWVARERVGPGDFTRLVSGLASEVLVAEAEGRLVGVVASEDRDGHISDLWVAPWAWGRGVGSSLLAAIEARIAGRGHAEAEIDAMAANARAIGLHRRRGYSVVWQGFEIDPLLHLPLEKARLTKPL